MQPSNSITFRPELLSQPVARAAYSDRTAWLMATMSRLAYLKFENEEQLLDDLVPRLVSLDSERSIRRVVADFIKDYHRTQGVEQAALQTYLNALGFELVDTFSNSGTQAFLARRERDRMAILAFRGTEKDFRDIKTDLNARFYNRDGVKIHNGFYQAFSHVQAPITLRLIELEGYKLYITGHSLGGALAIIATRALSRDNVAACYTFGSPRVGASEFGDEIKVPIYRVVNAADIVPRVPPTLIIDATILFCKLFRVVPYFGIFLIRFLENFRGYSHHGDMRYLTACEPDFSDLRLIANPETFRRVCWLIARVSTSWKANFTDHGIDKYCKKLESYALTRAGTVHAAEQPERRIKRQVTGDKEAR